MWILGMERWMSMMMMMEMVEEKLNWEYCNRHCGLKIAFGRHCQHYMAVEANVFEVLN